MFSPTKRLRIVSRFSRHSFDGQTAVFVPMGMTGQIESLDLEKAPCSEYRMRLTVYWDAVVIQDLNEPHMSGQDSVSTSWEEKDVRLEDVQVVEG